MKLPPAALTAPSLCPRCDSPAILTDFCVHCALQLRHCGACLGVAGPFDRFCGFCGYELIQGERRSPVWRLWILIALVPLAAGIAFGVSPLAGSALGAVNRAVNHAVVRQPVQPGQRSPALGLGYSTPAGWQSSDGSRAAGPAAIPWVLMAKDTADLTRAADARGDVFAYRPSGTVVEIGRPAVNTGPAAASDPSAVAAVQVLGLTSAPPPGTTVSIAREIRALKVGGRPAAEVTLRLTRATDTVYVDRTYVYAPQASGGSQLVVVDALIPSSDWNASGPSLAQPVLDSLSFS